MARQRVVLHRAGVYALLKDPGVEAYLSGQMAPVLQAAMNTAPVASGAYVGSLEMVTVTHATRVVARVQSTAPHGLAVEGKHGTLTRALDASGGRPA